MTSWITNLFESIMGIIYKLYIMLMNLAAPFRMAIVLLVIALLLPYLIKFSLWLVQFLVNGGIKLIEAASNKMGSFMTDRRKQGKKGFFGIGFIDLLFSLFLSIFSKTKNALAKIPLFSPKVKKNYRILIVLCLIGLPIWSLYSPTGKVGTAWGNFEEKLIAEHLQPLGYDVSTYKNLEHSALHLKNWFQESKSAFTPDRYVTPNSTATDGVYVREQPNMNSKVLVVLPHGMGAPYLEEEQQDEENRTWYKVRINDTTTGWLSANVVELREHNK